MRYLLIIFIIGFTYGHNGRHSFFTPYISPGIQIGYNADNTLFLSCQLTIGSGFKYGDHFEDTIPFSLGNTFGLRVYYQKDKPLVIYKYYDRQIFCLFGGIGEGKLINRNGNSFKRNKYWLGALGLLTYEKIFFDEQIQKQYGFMGVLPLSILNLIDS
jgi:hypothetical protein